LIGFVLGMMKLTAQTMVRNGSLAPEGLFGALGAYNGYYYTGILFLISVVLIIGISLATAPQDESSIAGMTFGSVTAEHRAEDRATVSWPDYVGTAVVLGIVLWIYIYFTIWL